MSPIAPAGNRTRNLSITSPAFCQPSYPDPPNRPIAGTNKKEEISCNRPSMRSCIMTCYGGGGGGGFFLACEDFGRMFDHSFPVCAFFFPFFFSSEDQLMHTNSILYARIGPQWLSELGQLWPCSLTRCVRARFRIGSLTMPGQRHSQPTPTSLGQGCMRV